jgi:hypothetical protein
MEKKESVWQRILNTVTIWQLLASTGVTGVIYAIVRNFVSHVRQEPLGWQIFFVFGIFCLATVAVHFLWPYVFKQSRRETPTNESTVTPKIESYPEFYPNRAAMDAEGRSLAVELRYKDVSHFWISCESGQYLTTLDEHDIGKIKRLTILDGDCQWAKDLVMMISSKEISGRFALGIKDAMRFAMKQGVPLRLCNKPMMNVVIANPESLEGEAWARINISVPYTTSEKWPVLVIYRTKEPRLFAVIKDSYDEMWKNANEPPKP